MYGKENQSQSNASYSQGGFASLQDETSVDTRFEAKEQRKSFRRLSQIPGIEDKEAMNMAKWSSEERQAEIKRLNDKVSRYKILMFMVSMNSGWFFYTSNFQLFYCRDVLDMSAPAFSAFGSNTNLPWLIKPLWGFFSDSFRFFGFRFKAHIMMATTISMITAAWMAIDSHPTVLSFTISNLILSWSVAYVDTMAEGMSAVITKIYERIKVLEELENGKKDGDDESMTAFGSYNAIRSFFRSVMGYIGGVLAPVFGKSTFFSGVLLGAYPLLMFLYALLIFKEERKSGFFTGCEKFCSGLKGTAKAAFMPLVLLPLLYIVLPGLPPNPGIYTFYMLVGEGGWTFQEYNINNFVTSVLMSLVLMSFFNLVKGWSFTSLQIWGQILAQVTSIASTSIIWCRYFSVIEYSIILFVINFVATFASNIQLTAIVGRVSKYLPEGFESTGVTTIISASNAVIIINGYVNQWFFPYFNIKPGYYDSRLKIPFDISNILSVFWVLVGPLFLFLG